MRVVISGLTAAGKTTHSKILSEKYKMEYHSASEFLLDQYNVDKNIKNFWDTNDASDLDKKRENNTLIDKTTDEAIKNCFNLCKEGIFDAWGLPWLLDPDEQNCISIWLESDLESRIKKAIISSIIAGRPINDKEARRIINNKDQQSKNYFFKVYGFDIFTDRHPFDLIIDVSNFIEHPNVERARISISIVDDILSSYIGYRLYGIETFKNKILTLRDEYKNSVFLKLTKIL